MSLPYREGASSTLVSSGREVSMRFVNIGQEAGWGDTTPNFDRWVLLKRGMNISLVLGGGGGLD